MYGEGKYDEVRNSIAIEFDMRNNNDMYDPNLPVSGSHVAITQPVNPNNNDKFTVRHDAISPYAESSIMNDQDHRVIINWDHTSNGVDLIENTADDIYVLKYRVFTGSTPAQGETAVVSGSQQYTRAQALGIFGTDQIRLSVTGSSEDSVQTANVRMSVAFPSIYDYTVQYMMQDKEGNPSTTPVPGLVTGYANVDGQVVAQSGGTLNPIPGKTSRSTIDLAPLPAAPPGFELVQGQSTLKYVSDNPTDNVFTFYYRPSYIPYTVNYYMEDGSQPAGSEVYNLVFTETPQKYGFVGDTVTATSREVMLSALLSAGTINANQYDLYANGFLYVPPTDPDNTIKSVTEGVVSADNPYHHPAQSG